MEDDCVAVDEGVPEPGVPVPGVPDPAVPLALALAVGEPPAPTEVLALEEQAAANMQATPWMVMPMNRADEDW